MVAWQQGTWRGRDSECLLVSSVTKGNGQPRQELMGSRMAEDSDSEREWAERFGCGDGCDVGLPGKPASLSPEWGMRTFLGSSSAPGPGFRSGSARELPTQKISQQHAEDTA